MKKLLWTSRVYNQVTESVQINQSSISWIKPSNHFELDKQCGPHVKCLSMLILKQLTCEHLSYNVNDGTSLDELNGSLKNDRSAPEPSPCQCVRPLRASSMRLMSQRPFCPSNWNRPQVMMDSLSSSLNTKLGSYRQLSPTCSSCPLAQAHYKNDASAKEVIDGRLSKNEFDCVQSGAPQSFWVSNVKRNWLHYNTTKRPMPIYV